MTPNNQKEGRERRRDKGSESDLLVASKSPAGSNRRLSDVSLSNGLSFDERIVTFLNPKLEMIPAQVSRMARKSRNEEESSSTSSAGTLLTVKNVVAMVERRRDDREKREDEAPIAFRITLQLEYT